MPLRMLEFFPIPFLLSLTILTVLVIRSRRRGWKFQLSLVIFGAYLMAVLVIVFFPIPVPADWPTNLSRRGTLQALSEVNLNLFRTAARLITLNAGVALLRDLTMNFLLTIPFGIGLASLKPLNFRQTLLYTLLVGLSLEGIQLLIKLGLGVFYHAIDINDVMMNGLGFLTGALLILGLRKITSSARRDRSPDVEYGD